VIYLLAIMSEITSSSSTMISSPMVETSVLKKCWGLWWSWMDPTTCYERRCSVYSLALKTNSLISFKIHLLLYILLMWP